MFFGAATYGGPVETLSEPIEAGYAYEVNNTLSHEVANNGTTDRIHLIFEQYDAASNAKLEE